MTDRDFVIVGAGLTGATIARVLADAGHSVLVVERRAHVAGNVFDYVHASGVRINMYGPHYFRTSSRAIWDFVQRFGRFRDYSACVLARTNGHLRQWPIAGSYVRSVAPDFVPTRPSAGATFEDAACALVSRPAFDLFVRQYSEKQWGTTVDRLSAELAKRIRVNWDDDPRLTPTAAYQGLPVDGYTALVSRMLEGIPCETGVDYLRERQHVPARRMTVYTGGIDEYFGYSLGRLKYRGQQRTVTHVEHRGPVQPVAQVNEVRHSGGLHIRRIEWQLLMEEAARPTGETVITEETPFTPPDVDGQEYPFPDEESRSLFERYRRLAMQTAPDVLFCGRLGEYRYLDMDQAIARGLMWARQLTGSG